MWELDYKESWAPKNWCFWTVVLEKTLESPLDCKEIKLVNLKRNHLRNWKWKWLSPTLCDPMDCSTPGLPVHHQLSEFSLLKLMSIESVMPSNHLILCRPLLLPPSPGLLLPSIFSNESALHSRWPKYWSFSFNISPSNEYSGLISFRMDWLDLLAV